MDSIFAVVTPFYSSDLWGLGTLLKNQVLTLLVCSAGVGVENSLPTELSERLPETHPIRAGHNGRNSVLVHDVHTVINNTNMIYVAPKSIALLSGTSHAFTE